MALSFSLRDRGVKTIPILWEDGADFSGKIKIIQIFGGAYTDRSEHDLCLYSYKIPTFCSHCGKMLMGFFRQGLNCKSKGSFVNLLPRFTTLFEGAQSF